MLDIRFIREHPDEVKEGCRKKGVDFDLDRFLEVDEKRRKVLLEVEGFRAQQKRMSKEIHEQEGGAGQHVEIDKVRNLKARLRDSERELRLIEDEFHSLMRMIPNLPLPEVPEGRDETENVVIREVGQKPTFDFAPRDYMKISEGLDIIDTKRAAKVSGSRFGYLKGDSVLLEFALVRLAIDTLTKEGFIPVIPPVMLNYRAMDGMGYLTRGGSEVYQVEKDDLYLVGTSEQSLGAMHMDEILDERDLPRRYAGFSTCFRREAGSYGKDTKGILRVHQFDKVEMFSFCEPEKSRDEHDFFLEMEEKLVRMLGIPYRVVQMCSGDLGDPAADKRDIECWMPGMREYRETHSCSNCTDFQARRLKVRYRAHEGGSGQTKVKFVHTLNGTAYAIGRMIIAIIENFQQSDGTILVPDALRGLMGGIERIGKSEEGWPSG
ncbi:MAG: serine--tRNA ligase [Thermodesulfobacteriota bacterium]